MAIKILRVWNNSTREWIEINIVDNKVQIVSGDKGWFATESALNIAYPTGENGWFAIIGATDTVWVWDSGTSAWVDSGSGGLVASVNGKTGVVVLTTTDIAEGTNKYYTEVRVSANADVAANTTHSASDGKDHSDVVTNNAKVSYDDAAAVALNTTHRSSDGKNHADVVLNNTHRGLSNNPHTVTAAQAVAQPKGSVALVIAGSATTIDLSLDKRVYYLNADENVEVAISNMTAGRVFELQILNAGFTITFAANTWQNEGNGVTPTFSASGKKDLIESEIDHAGTRAMIKGVRKDIVDI